MEEKIKITIGGEKAVGDKKKKTGAAKKTVGRKEATAKKTAVKRIVKRKIVNLKKKNENLPVVTPDKKEKNFSAQEKIGEILAGTGDYDSRKAEIMNAIAGVKDDGAAGAQNGGADKEPKITSNIVDIKKTKAAETADEEAMPKRSLGVYRRIAFTFIILTAVLLAVIFYFLFSKVSITLIPSQSRMSDNLVIDIYDVNKNLSPGKGAIDGVVQKIKLEKEGEYPATGENIVGEEVSGKVRIVNNYNKNQPLVATTRLMAPDGKLFRLKETVNVPAGGSAEAEVYADEPSKDMAVSSTRFTIPGLWAGLQDKIYAESEGPIEYKQKVEKYILSADIDDAKADLKKALLAEAKETIGQTYKEYSQLIYDIDENSLDVKTEAKEGGEQETFKVAAEGEVVVVGFDGKKASKIAEQRFMTSLPSDKRLVDFDANGIIYALSNCDDAQGTASVNASFEGKITLKEDTNIVDINKILGLNEAQLNAYLSSLPDVAGYEIRFFPSFIKKVPKLADRVKVEVRE